MKKIIKIISIALLLLLNSSLYPRIGNLPKPTTSASKTAAKESDLIAANKAYKKARTPEEKAAARKAVIDAATNVLKSSQLSVQRNLKGELTGYEDEEKGAAENNLIILEVERALLKKTVDKLEAKKLTLEDKGWIWNTVKPGKEAQHTRITAKLNEFKPKLEELNKEIREQSIVAGKQRFTKTRAFALASLASVMSATALVAYYGPATSKAALLAFKADPTGHMQNAASAVKNMVAGWLGKTPAVGVTAAGELAGTGVPIFDQAKLVAQYGMTAVATLLGLYHTYSDCYTVYQLAGQTYQAAIDFYNQLASDATPAQRQAAINQKDSAAKALKKAEADYKAASQKYQAELTKLQKSKK